MSRTEAGQGSVLGLFVLGLGTDVMNGMEFQDGMHVEEQQAA